MMTASNPGRPSFGDFTGLAGQLRVALLNRLQSEQNTKLYRSYVAGNQIVSVMRHRGKSPRRVAFFFRNPEMHFQATQLAGLYVMHGLLEGTVRGVEARYRLGSLDSGELLCQTYEAYLDLHSPAGISFEHAWFLLLALGRRNELMVGRCARCGALELRDMFSRRSDGCAGCMAPPC
jgi:hypothetical protein